MSPALDMMTDTNENYDTGGLRWQSSAIMALQEATEAFLVHLFTDACVFSLNIEACMLIGLTETYVLYTLNVLL